MQTFTSQAELNGIEKNKVFGLENLTMKNSKISFNGENNILFIEENVTLENSEIKFNGSNSVVYLSDNARHVYKINVSLYNGCVFFSGKDNYFNGVLKVVLSEQKHMVIGNSCLFSFGIWVRTADPHLVYSVETRKRVNPSRSVYLGDHVWIGQDAFLLKGTQVFSGSIVGARSLVAGKKIPSNTSFAGNPVKKIAEGVFWDEHCVHKWTKEQTDYYLNSHNKDTFIYKDTDKKQLSFDIIDERLSSAETAEEKLNVLKELAADDNKNRFSFCIPNKKTKSFISRLKRYIKRKLGK